MRVQVELTAEQEKELFAEMVDGLPPSVQEKMANNATIRRSLVRAAIARRMPA